MKFYGFQKMTVLDYPGKIACTLFTGGCNFRCPFCHNATLVTGVRPQAVAEEEIFSYLEKRRGILDGVCVTGGEPLLSDEIFSVLGEIRKLGYCIKLDTNGSFPEKLKRLIEAGLVDYVAMDIKNSKEKYAATVGIPAFDLAPVEQSVSLLLEGRVDYEFRTTVVGEFHTAEEIRSVGQWIGGAKRYFLQNFVDSGDLIGAGLTAVPREKMKEFCKIASEYVENASVRGI